MTLYFVSEISSLNTLYLYSHDQRNYITIYSVLLKSSPNVLVER